MENFYNSGKNNKYRRECIIRGSSEIIITENGEAVLYKDSDNSKFMTSNIFAARITEYVPQLHSFFVDIGDGSRRALLSADECSQTTKVSSIRDEKLRVGDYCLVQITTAPRGKKGAQVTTKARLVGVYTVLLPGETDVQVNISGKIRDSEMRTRLAMIGESIYSDARSTKYSLIFRTESANAATKDIVGDYENLCKLWEEILEKFYKFVSTGSVGLIYSRNPLYSEILKYPLSSYSKICADTVEVLDDIKLNFPEFDTILHFIPKRIFETKSVDKVLASSLGRKVYLKSGADIVIEKTEALTVIDVNSGKSSKSYSEINFEAATEIMRQLRLRDIGGIIVCDFIEPDNKKDRLALVDFMRELALIDPSKPEIPGISQLGLIEISRKRN